MKYACRSQITASWQVRDALRAWISTTLYNFIYPFSEVDSCLFTWADDSRAFRPSCELPTLIIIPRVYSDERRRNIWTRLFMQPQSPRDMFVDCQLVDTTDRCARGITISGHKAYRVYMDEDVDKVRRHCPLLFIDAYVIGGVSWL